MIFTIAQTFFYALWQAFGYSMATLGLHRAGLLHRQRHLRAFLWLLPARRHPPHLRRHPHLLRLSSVAALETHAAKRA